MSDDPTRISSVHPQLRFRQKRKCTFAKHEATRLFFDLGATSLFNHIETKAVATRYFNKELHGEKVRSAGGPIPFFKFLCASENNRSGS